MFWPVRLAVPALDASMNLPAASPPPGMAIYALPTGAMHSQAVFAYRGGAPGESRDFTMTAYLVRHPRGDLLIDSGFGSQVDAQFARLPMLMQVTSTYSKGTPAAQQLTGAGIEPGSLAGVLLTHAHWDHVSGMTDLPGVPAWLSEPEAAFVHGDLPMAAIAHSMPNLTLRPYAFADASYLGYPRSFDVWGDGSIVVVPAPGHTPGSVVIFVTLPAARYAFLGDIVWQGEGIERPAERPWISRHLVDLDGDQVRTQIEHLAALHRRFPQIVMVPAHDARPTATMPRLTP
jgi:glyoxylase-like metal-dependent hydrolase (beta-lactamase superfamily II)